MFLRRVEEAKSDVDHDVHRMHTNNEMLHELNEYLFDIFDANCMEEYQVLDDFERRAASAFDENDSVTEFTHEQYKLHQEFLQLFESLIDRFLTAKNYTSDQLYSELHKHYRNMKEIERHIEAAEEAQEVVDVIAFYTNFDSWATMMRENARIRRNYKTFVEKIIAAVANDEQREQSAIVFIAHK